MKGSRSNCSKFKCESFSSKAWPTSCMDSISTASGAVTCSPGFAGISEKLLVSRRAWETVTVGTGLSLNRLRVPTLRLSAGCGSPDSLLCVAFPSSGSISGNCWRSNSPGLKFEFPAGFRLDCDSVRAKRDLGFVSSPRRSLKALILSLAFSSLFLFVEKPPRFDQDHFLPVDQDISMQDVRLHPRRRESLL